MTPNDALLKFLRTSGTLSVDVDPEVLKDAKELPIWFLTQKGYVKEVDVSEAFRKILGINSLNLDDPAVSAKLQVDRFAHKLAGKFVWRARLIPLFESGNEIVVAAANPLDHEAITAVGFALSKPVQVWLAPEVKILALLAKHFPQQNVQINSEEDQQTTDSVDIMNETQDLDASGSEAAPIIKLANKIIADAVTLNASDIHLEPTENNLSVRFRIDGVLQDIITIPKQIKRNLTMRFKVVAGMDISERRRPQDGRIRVTIGGKRADMRVSSIPVAAGEKLVLRLMRADYGSLSFEDLSMPSELRKKLETTLRRQGKMVLVCGPTGSGKTTTLYVALNYLSDRTTNITTIEDPIEYKFEHINQIQVNNAANIGFASILRAILRQDPDIIMIGEIRDSETLKIVVQAAQTGHLVLSTVHTNDATSAVARLLDLGAEPFNLSTALAGVLAQRLTRKTCEKCKAPVPPGSLSEFKAYLDKYKIDPTSVRAGSGCQECFYSGFKGQQGIFSYLEVNDEISELIYNRASQEKLQISARKSGFLGLDEAAAELVKLGITSLAEVLPFLTLEPIPQEEALPVAAASAPAFALPELRIHLDQSGKGSVGRDPSQPMESSRVLIVDDNKNVRKMLIALLQNEMVTVEEAQNGKEALQKVYDRAPSLIICDLKMPEMDGKEFLQRIHKNKQTRDIPVIMLTVDDSEECEIDLIDRGAYEFLSKRSSPSVLVSRIRRVLDALT